MSSPSPLSPNFNADLLQDFKKGSMVQFDKINMIRSKIIFYSLAIQVMIQKVIDKEQLILTNGVNEPFTENACCNSSGSINTLKYFTDKEGIINDYNKQVTLLRNNIDDIISVQKSSSLYDPSNTRTKYPDIPLEFGEQTIYLAFITYCKFNSDIPIPESVEHLCHSKPSSDIYSPLEDIDISSKIKKLKESGEYNYTPEALQALLQIVNKEHIIPFNFNPTEVSYIQRMRDLIRSCQERHLPDIPEDLLSNLETLLDTYDIKIEEDTQELRQFKNYLSEMNQGMVSEIMEFILQYKRLDKKKLEMYKSLLLNISNFRLIGDSVLCPKRDTTTYKGMQFVINEMRNLISVFPNIIMNTVNNQKISIPKHWGLSKQHIKDIQTIVKNYYSSLEKFIKDKDGSILTGLVKSIAKDTNEWVLFALNTPLFARVSPLDASHPGGFGEGEEVEVQEIEEEEMHDESGQRDLMSGLLMQQSNKKGKRMTAQEREEREERGETAGSVRSRQPEEKGYYSIFNESMVRRLFTYYFLNVVLKYVRLSKSTSVVVEEQRLGEDEELELMSVLEAQDKQNGVVKEVVIVSQENTELKNMVANLLLVFFDIVMTDKSAINVNKKSVKEDITQSKDKEKDIITREFREMQITEREVENIKKNLRLGEWNVGATKGLRSYVPETYEQEREEMEREFRREEEKAKLENRIRKNDKVTERMRDIFADEEEEKQHQDGIIEADLADDFMMQGDDDEYGDDDDGAFNPRETSERDD
jgi:hypothetical protein